MLASRLCPHAVCASIAKLRPVRRGSPHTCNPCRRTSAATLPGPLRAESPLATHSTADALQHRTPVPRPSLALAVARTQGARRTARAARKKLRACGAGSHAAGIALCLVACCYDDGADRHAGRGQRSLGPPRVDESAETLRRRAGSGKGLARPVRTKLKGI